MKYALVIFVSLWIFSCRSSKVNKSTSRVTVDSVATERTDSTRVKKEALTSVTTEEKTEDSDLSVEFDNDTLTKTKPEDYLPPVVTIDPAGNVTITGKIKTVNYKENSYRKTVDSTALVRIDTAGVTKSKTVELSKDETTRTIVKSKKGFPLVNLFLWGSIAVAVWLFFYVRKKI